MKMINGVRLTSSHIAMYETIFNYSCKTQFCWASNSTLADEIFISKSYASHLISDLVRIGWVYRKITLDEKTKEFHSRQLVPLGKLCQPEEAIRKVKLMEQDHTKKGERMRLIANGKKVGIAPLRLMGALHRFGAEKVDRALAIVRASNVVNDPIGLFFGALNGDYTPGKRAKRLMGKAYITKQKHIDLVPVASIEREDSKPKDAAIVEMVGRMRSTAAKCCN